METPAGYDRTSEDATADGAEDPLARLRVAIEWAGLAVSVWWLWTMVTDEPATRIRIEAYKARARAWVARARQARRFADHRTVVDEAEVIVLQGHP
jgi:hypothetical protein